MKKSSKSQDVQRITVKSPLIPLFQRGNPAKRGTPPFGFFFLPEAGKGRLGGILKWLNNYPFKMIILHDYVYILQQSFSDPFNN
jgi:hypothetical protein